jgi:hypothetical protein
MDVRVERRQESVQPQEASAWPELAVQPQALRQQEARLGEATLVRPLPFSG